MIDLTTLRDALLVRDYGSIRKAAEILGIRASVLSRRIRALEDAIGVSLFQRHSHGIQPTVAGKRLLSQGSEILADVDALMRTAAKTGIGAEGHLAIGTVASIAGGRARELLTEFVSANPGVEIDVIEGVREHHAAAIRTLRMDVAIVVGAPATAGCNVELLWLEPIFVAVSDKSPLATKPSLKWGQLGQQRFLVSKANSGAEIHDIVMRHLADLGRIPVVEPRAVQRSGLLGLVSLGVGISLVGTAEAAVIYPGVVFRPLEGETLPFSAVWTDNNDNPALRRFLSLARAQMRKASSSLVGAAGRIGELSQIPGRYP